MDLQSVIREKDLKKVRLRNQLHIKHSFIDLKTGLEQENRKRQEELLATKLGPISRNFQSLLQDPKSSTGHKEVKKKDQTLVKTEVLHDLNSDRNLTNFELEK